MRKRARILALLGGVLTAAVLVLGPTAASADPSGPGGLPPGSPALTSCPMMAQGSRGECVRAVQNAFILLGVRLSVDGDYGPQTAAAVHAFQESHGLEADSVAGPQTLAALEQALVHPAPPVPNTGTVGPAGPDGVVLDNGVLTCGNLFGTCSYYYTRGDTKRIAAWLDGNGMESDATTSAVCARVGVKQVAAGLACEAFVVVKGNEFKDAAKNAAAGNGCLRIRWTQDPMVPVGAYNDGGRNCTG